MKFEKNIIIPLFMASALISCATRQQPAGGNPVASLQNVSQNSHAPNSKETVVPFWGKLFTEVCKKSKAENVCISPLSAQYALAMTANGATGETQRQMHGTLNIDKNANIAAKETLERLAKSEYGCEANIANSIWINEKLSVKQEFIDTNKEYFNALVTTAPFNKGTLQKINNWCSENTKGKIKSALDDIKKNDRMYLINALYFKGGWANEFNKEMTKEMPFTKDDGSVVNVSMMNQEIKALYYEDDVIQILCKDFDYAYEMRLILPAEGVTTEEAIAHLACNYENIVSKMFKHQVTLSMPKFQSDFSTSLKEPLMHIGMPRAFSNSAQFDGISDEPLRIDDVFQKTFIKVDETGAEAAALTVVRTGLLSMNQKFEERVMNLNRPFIYIIKNYQPENILFIGKVGNPNE